MSPLSFDNRIRDRNADCCVHTVDEKNTAALNLVNYDPVTHDILRCICNFAWVVSLRRLIYAVRWFLKVFR